jgi:competence protein ComEC
MSLIYLAIAWMLGIIAADLLPLPVGGLQVAAVLGALLAAAAWWQPRARLAGLLVCCAALGGWRYDAAQLQLTQHDIRRLVGRGTLAVAGMVQSDPKRADDGQQVVLAVRAAQIGAQQQPAEGLVLLKLPPYPEYHYGQQLLALGELQAPRAATRPGQFDYRSYLARKSIVAVMDAPRVRVQPGERGNPALRMLLAFRDHCKAVLLRELPEPQASLAVGILLGLQSSIPGDVTADFSTTGTSHILVISGWNISIIAAALYGLAGTLRLDKRRAFWAILACIWLYTLFVGATPTVIRAAVMGTIVVLGQRIERRAHAWTTLFAASWAMTLWDPQTLWDLGFQLSALATASLFAYGKGVERMLLRTPLRAAALGWAREALTATLAAQVLALPLILYHFGNLSLIAPLANVALLPMVPYAMLFGGLALLGGLAYLPLGQWLATAAYLFLAWLTEGARLLARIPWAAVQLPPFPLWVLLGYYAIVVGTWLWNTTLADSQAVVPGAISSHTPKQLA